MTEIPNRLFGSGRGGEGGGGEGGGGGVRLGGGISLSVSLTRTQANPPPLLPAFCFTHSPLLSINARVEGS